MNPTLVKALIAFVPVSALLAYSIAVFVRHSSFGRNATDVAHVCVRRFVSSSPRRHSARALLEYILRDRQGREDIRPSD